MNFKLTGLAPVAMLSCVGSAQMHYHLYNINSTPELESYYSTSLNNNGEVVGFAYEPGTNGEERGFFWSRSSGPTNLGASSRGTLGQLHINDNGLIIRHVGYLSGGEIERYDGSQAWSGIGFARPTTSFEIAFGLNNNDELVGVAYQDFGGYEPITWNPTNGFTIYPYPSWSTGEVFATAINDSGMIGGYSTSDEAVFVYVPGTGYILVRNGPGRVSAINNSGVALVGDSTWSQETGLVKHGLDQAVDLNDAGQIIGYKSGRPVLLDPTDGITYLDTMIDSYQVNLGYTFEQVLAINNNGQILGSGSKGQFLASYEPVPEPATLMIGAVGILGLLNRRRKRPTAGG